jgi:hypothetical protein
LREQPTRSKKTGGASAPHTGGGKVEASGRPDAGTGVTSAPDSAERTPSGSAVKLGDVFGEAVQRTIELDRPDALVKLLEGVSEILYHPTPEEHSGEAE